MLKVDFITNSIFNSRTYILSNGSDKVWLVDCGDVEPLLSIVGSRRVEGVLLTHAHFDHIYGLNRLLERNPSAKIYTSAFGYEALTDPKLNISRYHTEYDDFVLANMDAVEVLMEGDSLDIFGQKAEVFETPGHDESCLCFKIGNCFFSGDSYIPGVKVTAPFPHSNKAEAIDSEKRIIELSAGCVVYLGHEI